MDGDERATDRNWRLLGTWDESAGEWDFGKRKTLTWPHARVGTLAGDETCRRCGGENVMWAAPSPLWNLVMRGNDINAETIYADLVCIRCFIVMAEEAGIRGQWRVSVNPEPDGLIYETPSGRVWDAERWLWIEQESPAAVSSAATGLADPREASRE